MDKDVHSFPAEGFVAAGGAAVSLNYALAPAVTLDTIVEQCRTALEWVADNAGRLNGDPDRIFVSGHSAGGHLTAMMLCTNWAARGRPADLVKGGTPISGIFDLAPIMETSINDDVRLDAESAARNSPIHHLPQAGAPLIAAVGAAETPAFIAQNRAFAKAWQGARVRGRGHGDRGPPPLQRGERDGPPRQRPHAGGARPDGVVREEPSAKRRPMPPGVRTMGLAEAMRER